MTRPPAASQSRPVLEDIIEVLRGRLPLLREQYGVKSLAVFGSYVKGRHRKGSDLDILVEFEPDARVTFFRFVEMEHELGDLLGIRVDLVMRTALRPVIGERILAEALPV